MPATAEKTSPATVGSGNGDDRPRETEWMTAAEAAEYAGGVGVCTIREACNRNTLRHIRIGGLSAVQVRRRHGLQRFVIPPVIVVLHEAGDRAFQFPATHPGDSPRLRNEPAGDQDGQRHGSMPTVGQPSPTTSADVIPCRFKALSVLFEFRWIWASGRSTS